MYDVPSLTKAFEDALRYREYTVNRAGERQRFREIARG